MKNILLIIMAVSIACQFLAAFMAVRLIPLSGSFVAWTFLACGFIVQAIRRFVSLAHVLTGQLQGDMALELMGLIISVLMLCGIWKFRPLFSEIKRSQQVMHEKQDELQEINRKLEEEAAERRKAEETLRESEQQYRAVADYSYDWEYWIDADGSFRYISPFCKDVSGYDREEFLQDPQLLPKIIHPDDRNIYDAHFTQAFSCHDSVEPVEFRIITRDGHELWIEHVCRPVFDPGGQPIGRRSSNRNITERRNLAGQLYALNAELESRVSQRTAELARLNNELESFCYSISHELRAPIARLEAFSKVLSECVGEAGPEELLHLAERIGVSSLRLRSVIDALLQLNRIARAELDREEIDLTKMSRQILNELLEEGGYHKVAVSITPGLVVRGDRSMLAGCMQHLLDNALKYTAKVPEALIEIGQTSLEGTTVYYVRDNGAGFEMEFSDKLFEPFCRLHNDSEFEGSGIGLATVQRIIERHGGKIWAESVPGKGATFYFTLGGRQADS
jgi:PAS domain S-box-containing protein